MIRLDDWHLTEGISANTGKTYYKAHGIVTGHPKLVDGIYITTSVVEQMKLDKENNCLIMLTHSKNKYKLSLASINFNNFKETQDYLKVFNIPALSLADCQKLNELSDKKLFFKVSKILHNNELYLQLNGVFVQNAFYKNDKGEVRRIEVREHIGMFQDSYLITDWKESRVDFRYFDGFNSIRPYCWSDGLKAIKIENIGTNDITFLSGDNLVCNVGKVTTIESSQYSKEGLISSDVIDNMED